MNIKAVEEKTGIVKANIRFYEEQGLLSPKRDGNGYRNYEMTDIDTLRKIKLLRMMDIPLSQIKELCDGSIELDEVLRDREEMLDQQRNEAMDLQSIIADLLRNQADYNTLDAEPYLALLEKKTQRKGAIKKPAFPCQRFWARVFDFTLYNLLIYLLMPEAFQSHGISVFRLLASVVLIFLLEPVFLSVFYTTPGKAIMGLYVSTPEGKRLSYAAAMERTYLAARYGLGFGFPFLQEYMHLTALESWKDGTGWIWERNSKLGIRNWGSWRWGMLLTCFLIVLAIPAAKEYQRIFPPTQIPYGEESPFMSDYKVEAVLVGDTPNTPLVKLTTDELAFYTQPHTQGEFQKIGKLEYKGTEGQNLWEVSSGELDSVVYRLYTTEKNETVLECWENMQQKWGWKLRRINTLKVGLKTWFSKSYFTPAWFLEDSEKEAASPEYRMMGTEGTITLRWEENMPQSLYIQEERVQKEAVFSEKKQLEKNAYGYFEIPFTEELAACEKVIYKIPYEGGMFVFGVQ